MPSTGYYVYQTDHDAGDVSEVIAWYDDRRLAERVCEVLQCEFGQMDLVGFCVSAAEKLKPSDTWVTADKLIDATKHAVERREAAANDDERAMPTDFEARTAERYHLAARETAERILVDEERVAPRRSASQATITFDEDGALNVNGQVPLPRFLELLRDQIRLFLARLESGERAPNGDYLLSDANAGVLRGTWVLWEKVGLVAGVCNAYLLPPFDFRELERSESGVLIRHVSLPRNSLALGDLLRQLTFAILCEPGGAWPAAVSASTVEKIRRLADELELHWIELEGGPTRVPDPNVERLGATQHVEEILTEVKAVRRELRESTGLQENPPTPDEPSAIGEGKSPETVRDLAETHLKRNGGVWPGLNALTRFCGCSKDTLYKAVGLSPYLAARKAEHEVRQGNANVRGVPAGSLAQQQDLQAVDPVTAAGVATDDLFARLLDAAETPEKRRALEQLPPDKRAELVSMICENPAEVELITRSGRQGGR